MSCPISIGDNSARPTYFSATFRLLNINFKKTQNPILSRQRNGDSNVKEKCPQLSPTPARAHPSNEGPKTRLLLSVRSILTGFGPEMTKNFTPVFEDPPVAIMKTITGLFTREEPKDGTAIITKNRDICKIPSLVSGVPENVWQLPLPFPAPRV